MNKINACGGSPLKSFKQYLQSQGKSKSTIEHYQTYLLDFLSYLDRDNTEIESSTAKEVLAYLSVLQKRGQQNKTRGIRLGVIKQFFNCQIEVGMRVDNPISHLKIRGTNTQKLYPLLDKQQLDCIYSSYVLPEENSWHWLGKQRNKSIISLLINQGLTTPEIERLELSDLQLKEGLVFIRGSKKSNERTLELKSNQILELMEYTWQVRPKLLEYQREKSSNAPTNLFLPAPKLGQKTANNSFKIWSGLTKDIKRNNNLNVIT
jgi:integrase/recombinase XerD